MSGAPHLQETLLTDLGCGAAEGAHPAVGWMQGTAVYLRENDLPTMQADLEGRVREKPLQTLFLALGAGWLLGVDAAPVIEMAADDDASADTNSRSAVGPDPVDGPGHANLEALDAAAERLPV